MSSDLISYSEVKDMATAISKSGLFGIKTPEQAIALMLIAQAEGLHPAIAARDYHIIQGRPALKADAMLARFQSGGGRIEWLTYTDTEVSAKFSHPSGGSITISWSIESATRAGLTGKEVWRQYPRQMLRARVISEGIRTVAPGYVAGMYTPEEVQDFDTPAPIVQTSPSIPPTARVLKLAPAPAPVPEPEPELTEDNSQITALELIALITEQNTSEAVAEVCARHRDTFKTLSDAEQAEILAARKLHLSRLAEQSGGTA